ncbi:hypothetical protein Tco_0967250 [Tanacetum coccineum]
MKNGAIKLYDEEGSKFIINKQRVNPYQKNLLDTNKDDGVTLEDEGEITYFSFGRHLEDLHVTWAHLEKKRTRLQTNTKTLEDLCLQSLDTMSQAIHDAVTTHKVTASQHFETASAHIDSHSDLEDSTYDGVMTKARCHERNAILEKERNALDVKVIDIEASAMTKECELTDLNAMVHELEFSSSELQEKVTMYENCMEQLEKFRDDQMKVVNNKFDMLYTDFVEMALHLEEKLAAISKAIEKELKSSKDASIDVVMNIIRLEEPLADKLTLNEMQPNVDQLMVPIYHSPDKVVIGATALSFALDVSSIHILKIKENITNQRLALCDVFVPLAKPFSVATLIGTEGTAVSVAATMALSTTFDSASSIAPIFVDDYEVIGTDAQAVADEHVASFPNIVCNFSKAFCLDLVLFYM